MPVQHFVLQRALPGDPPGAKREDEPPRQRRLVVPRHDGPTSVDGERDQLVCAAVVPPHEAADFLRGVRGNG